MAGRGRRWRSDQEPSPAIRSAAGRPPVTSERAADAVGAYLDGLDVARRFGALGNYGPRLLPDAAVARLSLGRREEARELLAEAFELDLVSPAHRLGPLTARAMLRLWEGDLAAAQADLAQVLAESPAALDPDTAASMLSCRAEAAHWDGRLADARAAVAGALEILADAEDPCWVTGLCRGDWPWRRQPPSAPATGTPTPSTRPPTSGRVACSSGSARRSPRRAWCRRRSSWQTCTPAKPSGRGSPGGDPRRWASSARAWEALRFPWLAAYARWRQAEALLAAPGSRNAARTALARAWVLASTSGARLLVAEIQILARRADRASPAGTPGHWSRGG